jgi:hypothetical protein
MVKISQTELLKLKCEIIAKNAFSGFCQKFRKPLMKLKNYFCQFPNPWVLRVLGMGCYTSKCEKNQKSLHPNIVQFPYQEAQDPRGQRQSRE